MTVRVDWRASVGVLGRVLQYLSVSLVLPIVVALVYGDPVAPFVVTGLLALAGGYGLDRLTPQPDLGAREGFLVVALTWLVVALVGAVPYLVAGIGTGSTLRFPVNAVFESMSGFTTTGATVMGTISVEQHGHALLLWRQLTQWLGGMGIVVLAVAILPELSVGGAQLMDAEAPGPGIEKLTPRIAETARALWTIYAGITVLEMLLLYGLHLAGLAPEMTPYNAVAHGLTTMSTGGFSPEARSIEAFSGAVQWLVIPFMAAAGTNFALFWHVLDGRPRTLLTDPEFRTYAVVLSGLATLGVAVLFVDPGLVGPVVVDGVRTAAPAGNLELAARHAVFQAVSIVTTTGYASMDFNAWSGPARYLLVFAMFIGGSAGSTGGGIKIVRWLLVAKGVRRELFTTVHPDAVRPVRLAGRPVEESALRSLYGFTLLYLGLFLVGALLLSADAALFGDGRLAVIEAVTAAAATLGNVGPGLGAVGPMGNYRAFTAESKLLMVLLMWIGRLEILPVLVLLTRGYWKR